MEDDKGSYSRCTNNSYSKQLTDRQRRLACTRALLQRSATGRQTCQRIAERFNREWEGGCYYNAAKTTLRLSSNEAPEGGSRGRGGALSGSDVTALAATGRGAGSGLECPGGLQGCARIGNAAHTDLLSFSGAEHMVKPKRKPKLTSLTGI